MNEIYISKEQYEKLKQELEYLKTEGRKKVAEMLKTALSFGDITENAEYDEAQKAKERLEAKIYELEQILKSAKIIKGSRIQDRIVYGTKFEVLEKNSNKKYIFTLVGFGEANPLEGKISTDSPLGKAFLNKKVGEIVKIETPKGEATYEILRILSEKDF